MCLLPFDVGAVWRRTKILSLICPLNLSCMFFPSNTACSLMRNVAMNGTRLWLSLYHGGDGDGSHGM